MADQASGEAPQSSPTTKEAPKSSGSGCLRLLIFGVILFGAAFFGGFYGIRYYAMNCQGMGVSECILSASEEASVADEKENSIVKATGPYTYSGHSVVITLNIPLQGGSVTGTVEGECHGKAKGTYDGKDMGTVSGTLTGYCDLAIVPVPAKATFQGMVNKKSKKVPVGFDGSAAGFTHSGSVTLSY